MRLPDEQFEKLCMQMEAAATAQMAGEVRSSVPECPASVSSIRMTQDSISSQVHDAEVVARADAEIRAGAYKFVIPPRNY